MCTRATPWRPARWRRFPGRRFPDRARILPIHLQRGVPVPLPPLIDGEFPEDDQWAIVNDGNHDSK